MLEELELTKPNSAFARSRKRNVGPVVFCSLPMEKDWSSQRTGLESSAMDLGKGGMVMRSVEDRGINASIYGLKDRWCKEFVVVRYRIHKESRAWGELFPVPALR